MSAAAIVLVAGMIGFMTEHLAAHPGPLDAPLVLRLAFQSFAQAVQLFWFNISAHPETDNWLLVAARICGAIVTAAAAFRLITSVFRREYLAFKASFYRDHAVFLGYGLRNAMLAECWRDAYPSQRQIVLDHDPSRVRPLASGLGRLHLEADLALPGSLDPAGIGKARLVVIGTGSDERNLAICQQVMERRSHDHRHPPAKIIVTLDDAALADRCRNDARIGRLDHGDTLHFQNHAHLAARQLLSRTPFIDRAMVLRQTRARLLFAGFSQTALEVIIQFLRVSPFEQLGPARIDIVTADIQAARELIIERIANLRHMLEDDGDAPLAWAGRIHLHAANPALLTHASELSDELAAHGPVTAIVIAADNAVENVKTALAVRPWTAQVPDLAAPVYVLAGVPSTLTHFYTRFDGIRPKPISGPLAALAGSDQASEVIEPFGMLEEICAPEFLFGRRERLARRLHEAYRQKQQQALHSAGATGRSDLPDWDSLDETYRQANRRAIDLLPVARLVAGVPDWWDGDGLPAAAMQAEGALEKLARLAHASWRIDREL